MANKLYKFSKWFGRNGTLEGTFIAEENSVNSLIKEGALIYFGEVLGKHSEVSCVIKSEDVTQLNASDNTINELLSQIGNTVSGYNPFNYLEEEE